jgi:5-methylcytosine-specific restriction endonuclease McrA
MEIALSLPEGFKQRDEFDYSDRTAKTLEKDILEKLKIKKPSLYGILPASIFKREDGYILGVTLNDKSSSSEDKLNDIEKEIDEDHEAHAELSDDEEVEEVCQEPGQSLWKLKQKAILTNNEIAYCYKNMDIPAIISKPMPRTRSRKEKIPDWHKNNIWKKHHGTCERVKCPVCSYNDISSNSFHAGHILPESKGGMMCEENIMPICGECNTQMGSRHLYWFAWRFKQKILWPSHS